MLATPLLLLCVFQLPTDAQVKSVTEELRSRSAVPAYVKNVLEALPTGTHPMTQFSTLVMALQVCAWGGFGRRRPAT